MTRTLFIDFFILQKKRTEHCFTVLLSVFCHTLFFVLFIHICFVFSSTKSYGAESLTLGSQRDILGLPATSTPSQAPKVKSAPKKKTQTPKARISTTTKPPQKTQARALPPSAIGDAAGNFEQQDAPTQPLESSAILADEADEANEPTQETAKKTTTAPKSIRLFNTVDFRGPLKNIPKWARVLSDEKGRPSFYNGTTHQKISENVKKQWLHLKNSLANATLIEKMKAVNLFFNQWPYKTDLVTWGIEDYWATPQEFLKKSGDCEDYAIAKYYALRDLGVPASQLRVTALIETIRNIGHAVLIVFVDDKAYVLDNLSNVILQHHQLPHYDPKFSVNEEYRWVHVRPVKRGKK